MIGQPFLVILASEYTPIYSKKKIVHDYFFFFFLWSGNYYDIFWSLDKKFFQQKVESWKQYNYFFPNFIEVGNLLSEDYINIWTNSPDYNSTYVTLSNVQSQCRWFLLEKYWYYTNICHIVSLSWIYFPTHLVNRIYLCF